MDKVLYFDIETKNDKTAEVGAVFNGQELREKSLDKLQNWIEQAEYVCGHNIIAHDIPFLEKAFGIPVFQGKKIIDTLLWSPLIFKDNPYHRLVKGYKIVNEDAFNNPLSDSKLTADLLSDELNGLNDLDQQFQQILFNLLSHSNEYKSFLELAKIQDQKTDSEREIAKLFENKICNSVNISSIILENPVELAYAISLIYTKEDKSILPAWVSKTFPKTQQIIDNFRFNYCGNTSCTYCNSELVPKKALFKYFGYDDFRSFDLTEKMSLQEKTVRAGLNSSSFLAVFPTGGGKSLTFQLPALMKGSLSRQLTVIISPLVSLMKDQVENLENRFDITKAVAINGLLSPLERQDAIERVENGTAHLLYLSPESLRSPTILRILKQRSIARFVIDEAHCFSSWGQDFRVDYLYIADFIKTSNEGKLTGHIPVSCFTATAKPQVIEDIKAYFKTRLDLELDEYVTRASRTNLRYEVIDIQNPEQKMAELIRLLSECEKPAIIYASRTKRVEQIHGAIKEFGFNSTYFHGKLDKEVKKENMDGFMNGKIDIIVATSAFGMGVDKEDVKSVIHYNISDSLENYIQEAGRAGRNEKIQAQCYILFNEDDLNKHFNLLQQTKINHKQIQQIWKALKNLSALRKSKAISNSALEIAQAAGWETEMQELETKVKTSIAALEDQGFLKRKQNSSSIFANSLMVSNLPEALKIIHTNETISEKQTEHCSRVLQRIVKDDECRLDYLAERTGLKLSEIKDTIAILRDAKILGDARDLTAFINLSQSKLHSKRILDRNRKIESALHKLITKNTEISFRQLNQKVKDMGIESEIFEIRNILNYWEIRNFIQKSRFDRKNELYKIKLKNREELEKDIIWRHDLSLDVFELLESFHKKQNEQSENTDKKELPVGFSMLELKASNHYFGQIKEEDIKRYEKTLLFLNQIKSIKLEGGFMVSYNRLNVEEIDTTKQIFTTEHFQKMGDHYMHKTEQIHIVGEYAKRRLQNYESAMSYVNDYFSQPYEEFLAKYFPKRKQEIRTPLTPQRLKEITGNLDTDQLKIISDGKSDNILVLAGPGSGKTKVLVHKIASLLLLEDIKPEQFLMLTFSKVASLEFRTRTKKIVPKLAGFIKITTFHGFCFELLGQLGDLKKSENIIQEAIQAIRDEAVDISSISNKSVLLLDEFQDVNAEEWELVQTIIQKAEKIRVIAVGDDDQNIYEFRGSSNKNMLDFKKIYNATEYSLIKNYRNNSSIVQFNNELLNKIPNRLKTLKLEYSSNEINTKVSLIRYQGNHLEKSLTEKIIQDNFSGNRAVLVITNKQAMMIRTLLKDSGQKTKLLAGFEGFSMDRLLEMRSFTNDLKGKTNDAGLILNKAWDTARVNFKNQFQENPHFDICEEILKKFEMNYEAKKQLLDWYSFIREIKMEDAINSDPHTILISTIHKAKGKEFDHVYLLLENFEYENSESKRLVYVGCTRAKQNLQIHTNTNYFNNCNKEFMDISEFQGETEQPTKFEMVLSLKNIYLASQKDFYNIRRIENAKSGDELQKDTIKFSDNVGFGLANKNGENILIFSTDFKIKEYEAFVKNGYDITSAMIEHIVYWYDKETETEYKVVLPRIEFTKMK